MSDMLQHTFYPIGLGDTYESVATPHFSCPPHKIASIARDRVIEGAILTLPDGYDHDKLSRIVLTTGYIDERVRIDAQQASELRKIGEQILTLNEQGYIEPPLTYTEQESIQLLLSTVPSDQND